MTDELQRTDGQARYLLDHPQRFGILPTKWFWHDNDQENWRRVRWWLFVPLFITMAAVYAIGDMLLFAVVPAVVLVLMTGLLEKYVRRQIMKRRPLASAEELDEPEPLFGGAVREGRHRESLSPPDHRISATDS